MIWLHYIWKGSVYNYECWELATPLLWDAHTYVHVVNKLDMINKNKLNNINTNNKT